MNTSQSAMLFGAVAAATVFTTAPCQADATKSESKVKIEATAGKPDADGKQVVTVKIAIDKGWHLYANPVPKDFAGVPVEVKYGGKTKPAVFKVDYPPGKEVKDPTEGNYQIYEDMAEIKVTLQRDKSDTSPLELSVKVQTCNEKTCLPPATVKVPVQ